MLYILKNKIFKRCIAVVLFMYFKESNNISNDFNKALGKKYY